MAYLGDPREQAIDLDNHTIWEQDNRIEERWQWGAQVLDLCDMSPEEYMKNPLIEAVKSGADGSDKQQEDIKQAIADASDKIVDAISGSTTAINDNVDESTNEIVEAISGAAITIGGIISGTVYDQVPFYYCSVNNKTSVDDLTINDFIMNAVTINTDGYINYTLGDPTEEEWNQYTTGQINEQTYRELVNNDYYLAVPNAYGTSKKFVIWEEGTSDVTSNFVMVDNHIFSEFKLFKSHDIDHVNIDYPTEKNVEIIHKLKILK